MPISFNSFINCSLVKPVTKPGILSSLSIVPPVKPRLLPLIFGTFIPSDATIGAIIKVVLSPTPPVECLSTLTPGTLDKSKTSPLLINISVKLNIFSSVIPFIHIAIKSADI